MTEIKFEDWQKLDLRVGRIEKVEDIAEADKLYKLTVNIGEAKPKILVAGLKPYYKKDELLGKNCIVFCNLEQKELKGIKSEGMILAAENEKKDKVILIAPESDIELGSKIR